MGRKFKIGTKITGEDAATRPIKSVARAVRGDLRRSLSRASKAARKLGGGIKKVGKGLGVGAAVVGGAVVGLGKLVTGLADSGDELAKASRRAGLSAQEFAELRFAAEKAGLASEQFGDAMRTVTKNIGELRAKRGPLVEFLKQSSPQFLKLLRNTSNTSEALEVLFEGMARIEDPAARAALAAVAFGESGARLTTLVENGTQALEEQRAQFRKYVQISPEYLKAAEEFKDAQTESKAAIEGVSIAVAGKLLPAVTPLLKKFTDWIGKSENVERVSQGISDAIASVANWIATTDWLAIGKGISDAFGIIGNVVSELWEMKEVILVIAGALVLGKLVKSIASATTTVRGLASAFRKTKSEAELAALASKKASSGVTGGVGAVVGGKGKAAIAAAAIPAVGTAVIALNELEDAIGSFPQQIKESLAKFEGTLATARAFGIDVQGITAEDLFRDKELRAALASRLGVAAAGGTQEQVQAGLGFASTAVADQLLATQKLILDRVFAVDRGAPVPPALFPGTEGRAGMQQQDKLASTLDQLGRKVSEPTEIGISMAFDLRTDPGTKAEVRTQPRVTGKGPATSRAKVSLGSATVRTGAAI